MKKSIIAFSLLVSVVGTTVASNNNPETLKVVTTSIKMYHL